MKNILNKIFGAKLTTAQKVFAILYGLQLLFWGWVNMKGIRGVLNDSGFAYTFLTVLYFIVISLAMLFPLYGIFLLVYSFRLACRRQQWFIYYMLPFSPYVVVILLFLALVNLASYYQLPYDPRADKESYVRLGDDFSKDANHVWFRLESIENADPGTFRKLKYDYSVDSCHVFYRWYMIAGADPETFVVDEPFMGKDKNDVYVFSVPLHVSDKESFKLFYDKHNIYSLWAIDRDYIYYLDGIFFDDNDIVKTETSDYDSFRLMPKSVFYAMDKMHVYYQGKVIEGADPETFEIIDMEHFVCKDKSGIYFCGERTALNDYSSSNWNEFEGFYQDGDKVYDRRFRQMPDGTDFATIHHVKNRNWVVDSQRVYWQNYLVVGADPKTFHPVNIQTSWGSIVYSSCYGKDSLHVFCMDSLLQDADVSTFVMRDDPDNYNSYIASDKNQTYESEEGPTCRQAKEFCDMPDGW